MKEFLFLEAVYIRSADTRISNMRAKVLDVQVTKNVLGIWIKDITKYIYL